jgi:hypothetical protein
MNTLTIPTALKEIRRLQRELNSPRLRTYIEGQRDQDIERERAVKISRFNEILATLNKATQ